MFADVEEGCIKFMLIKLLCFQRVILKLLIMTFVLLLDCIDCFETTWTRSSR